MWFCVIWYIGLTPLSGHSSSLKTETTDSSKMLVPTTSQKNAIFIPTVIKTLDMFSQNRLYRSRNFNFKLLSDDKCLTLIAAHRHTGVPQLIRERHPYGCGHNEADPSRQFGTLPIVLNASNPNAQASQVWKVKSCSVWCIMAHVPIYVCQSVPAVEQEVCPVLTTIVRFCGYYPLQIITQ